VDSAAAIRVAAGRAGTTERTRGVILVEDSRLSSPLAAPVKSPAASHWRSVALVFSCTLLGALAQLLIKTGTEHITADLASILTNVPLIVGYALYGVNTLLMVLALKDGEMSTLYPIIALTYVWTTLLSYTVLGEPSNVYKNIGIVAIVAGVAVMGSGGRR
jgi:multidrug transporter EmrE-like cation transporter